MANTDFTGSSESRRYGVFRWGLLLSAVLLLLVVVVTVVLLFAVENTVLVLAVLAICLIVAGTFVCFFLEWLRRRAFRRRDEGANAWIRHTLSDIELAIEEEPSPLPEPSASSLTPRSSWIHWAPWKSSRNNGPPSLRGNGRPYSRNKDPPSSRSTDPPSTMSTDPPSTMSTDPPSIRSTDSPSYTVLARSGL